MHIENCNFFVLRMEYFCVITFPWNRILISFTNVELMMYPISVLEVAQEVERAERSKLAGGSVTSRKAPTSSSSSSAPSTSSSATALPPPVS